MKSNGVNICYAKSLDIKNLQETAEMNQLYLFERPTLNVIQMLKSAMREALKDCGLSRDQVAMQMTDIIHNEGLKCPGNSRSVSRAILDKWVGENSIHMIPVALIPVFCSVVRSSVPIQILAGPLRLSVITEEDTKFLLWAKAEAQKRKFSKQAKHLAEEISL